MPRFVILEHDHPDLHWDLMLEHGPSLKTWRLAHFPPGQETEVAALALADHRSAYLDYEGPVSGNRGRVLRRDQGTFAVLDGDLAQEGKNLVLTLHGEHVKGIVVLQHVTGDSWSFRLREE